MNPSRARALELVDKLTAEGVHATCDPRSATPPCVLVPVPNRRNDLACDTTAEWQLAALVPGPANADAWDALDILLAAVDAAVDWTRADFTQYQLSADNPPFACYLITVEESV